MQGSNFLFGSFMTNPKEMLPAVTSFAFAVLPTVIFFSALMAILYHLGIMQKVIKVIAWIMQKTMKTSGPETTSISANIFVGQTEAPLVIKPFIAKMTNSELMAVMTGGFATVAGGVMAIYVGMLQNVPGIAGHLMAASIMSAPAALVIAKIIYPEKEDIKEIEFKIQQNKSDDNILEVMGQGATDGLKLAANIAAMLIAFIAMTAFANYILSLFGTSLEIILGYIFMPLAFLMGAPWSEAGILGSLLGQKIVLTELIAYMNLSAMEVGGVNGISEKTAILASYALCGFANFASIGIQLGGIGSIAPERKKDLAKLVTKAMFGGALASWLTATIAGILL
jgi:CNT family concentrative nucleoside transporter